MQSERWRTCTDIFHAALERAPNERSNFIDESCGDDSALRNQVELLLKYHDEAGDFIASPALANAPELLADDPDALIGQHLGSYRIDAVLGVGGMGVVYLAYDERLARKVGLKLLPRAFVTDAAQLDRLKLEARTASALNHPNIVTVHEIGQVNSTHYIAIEFIEGITLRERITRGPVPPDEAREIMTQVASALCVAHRAGIVHRDLKPENIMIRPDGYVKVLDFGIAKTRQLDPISAATSAVLETNTRTQRGVVLGTMRYMSPEQTRGETVDARSDLWSLGVVLFEMLTGAAPFDGKTPSEVREALLREEPRPLGEQAADIPLSLQKTVAKCLRKDPDERFQSSEEMLAALRSGRAFDGNKKRRTLVFAGIGLACLLAVIAYLTTPAFRPSAKPAGDIALNRPTSVAVGANGIIYVADFAQHAIRQIAPDGTLTNLAGSTGVVGSADGAGALARFHHPGHVAIGRDRNIYVADTNNHLIRKITPGGVVSTWAGRAGKAGSEDGAGSDARFRFPTSIALDQAGNAYVADFANHTIRKIAPDGTVSTLAGTAGEAGSADGAGAVARFNQVHGVAVDGAGNICAADFGNHTVRKITPAGIVSTLAGMAENPGSIDGAGTAARFSAPYDVAVSDGGEVYVADTSNHTIRKITPAGMVSTLAGFAGNVGSTDGVAAAARFAVPAGVTIDRAGNVYVADFGNQAIRKITPDAAVSTIIVPAGPPHESTSKSIAVLPFTDLSPQRDQQYFSDGMSEEILNALAHVKDLKVAGRSSSFSFRGKDADLRGIGATLGVAHILEGSVRKQGDKVRITAQLIQVSDGFHLWSETYDGDLSDVFRLQERIARAITDQLQVVLQGEQKSRLVKTATSSTEAYALFLQATAIFNRRDSARFLDAAAQLHEALRLDPNFARAHARLASLSSIAPGYDVHLAENAGDIVTREAARAIELDPALAEPHAALGQVLFTQRRYTEARAAYERALANDADDSAANLWLSTLLCSTGHAKASGALLDKILIRDPMMPNALLWRGWAYLQRGAIDDADRSIRRAADAGLTAVGLGFAHVAQARKDDAGVVDWMARGFEPFMTDLPSGTPRFIAAGIVGNQEERARAIGIIHEYLLTQPRVISGAVPLALVWLGQPERALAVAQEKPTRNDTLLLASLWTAAGRNARSSLEFATFAQRSGLAEFWDKSGPPDLCQKNDSGDYVCE